MSVINITDQAHFTREIESHSGFVVIDFWAEFCGPCRRIAPDYEQLAAKYRHVKFLKVNTRECDGVPDQHRITKLPTFVFYQNRQQRHELEFSGANIPRLEEVITKHAQPSSFEGAGNRLGGSGAQREPSYKGVHLITSLHCNRFRIKLRHPK